MREKHAFPESDRESLEHRTSQYSELLRQSCHRFADLSEVDVPERIGVYIIYDDSRSKLPIYVGMVRKAETKHSGSPTGLRFRIMRNHLGRAGSDNFLRYLAQHIEGDKRHAVQYVKGNCSCRWIELTDPREVLLLEHFVISLLDPCLNRG